MTPDALLATIITLALEVLVATLFGLAVYRAAHMLALEDGPWDWFASWRDALDTQEYKHDRQTKEFLRKITLRGGRNHITLVIPKGSVDLPTAEDLSMWGLTLVRVSVIGDTTFWVLARRGWHRYARMNRDNWVGRGVQCVLCVSVWLALIAALYAQWVVPGLTMGMIPLRWLALAGIVLIQYKGVRINNV